MNQRLAPLILGFLASATLLLASDVTGIWAGTQEGRRGDPEYVAFRFKTTGATLTGTVFGDEFDLPIEDATLSGDEVRFSVTTKNYYSGTKTKFVYSGTVNGSEMTVTRERIQTPEEKSANRPAIKQTLKLKRLS
jgi:hypothetical protein